jgi:acetyl esterase/lipase
MALSSQLDPFFVQDITYKTVNNTPIQASVLWAKDLKIEEPHPLFIRWHGGYLITGARLSTSQFRQWNLDLARKHSAVIITADHRLLPESNGLEVLEDVADLWLWVKSSLPSILSSHGIKIDLNNIAVAGESAGGYLSIQCALLHPDLKIRAVISAYPVLDVTDRFFTEAYDKPIRGWPPLPQSVVEDHLKAIKPGRIVPGDYKDPLERLPLAIATLQHGRYLEFLGSDPKLMPIEVLKTLQADHYLPFLFVFHGLQDSAVPVEGTQKFEQVLRKVRPDARARFVYESGEHSFDKEATLETPWLKIALEEFEQFWPVRH